MFELVRQDFFLGFNRQTNKRIARNSKALTAIGKESFDSFPINFFRGALVYFAGPLA